LGRVEWTSDANIVTALLAYNSKKSREMTKRNDVVSASYPAWSREESCFDIQKKLVSRLGARQHRLSGNLNLPRRIRAASAPLAPARLQAQARL